METTLWTIIEANSTDTIYFKKNDSNYSCDELFNSETVLSSTWFQTTIYVLYTTVFVVALVGNVLVIYVVNSIPRMKTVTNYFIVNLAVGDILMDIFCVPTTFVSTLTLQYWPFGQELCPIVNYSQVIGVKFINLQVYDSLLIMTLVWAQVRSILNWV